MRRQRPVVSDGLNSLTMKTNTKASSILLSSPVAVGGGFTLGLDLGDRQRHVCALDATGHRRVGSGDAKYVDQPFTHRPWRKGMGRQSAQAPRHLAKPTQVRRSGNFGWQHNFSRLALAACSL